MAAPIVCVPCLEERHVECMNESDEWRTERVQLLRHDLVGGYFCVCWKCRLTRTDEEPGPWELSVWDRDMETLERSKSEKH